jgi:hypothetical protein
LRVEREQTWLTISASEYMISVQGRRRACLWFLEDNLLDYKVHRANVAGAQLLTRAHPFVFHPKTHNRWVQQVHELSGFTGYVLPFTGTRRSQNSHKNQIGWALI